MQVRFQPVELAPLTIYRHPIANERYTIGIDTATGVGQDYTVMQVLSNRLPFSQDATFRAKLSVVDAAEVAYKLGTFYNDALIVCETNYPGNAVQDALIMQYRYPHNYQAEERLDEDPSISCKYGFKTTQASKWLLIRELEEALKSNDIILRDKNTIEELMNYLYIEDKTKTGAVQGGNDDAAIAVMLAVHGCLLLPVRTKPQEQNLRENYTQQKAMMDRFIKSLQLNQEPQRIIL